MPLIQEEFKNNMLSHKFTLVRLTYWNFFHSQNCIMAQNYKKIATFYGLKHYIYA